MEAWADRSNVVTITTCALAGTFITVFIARQIMKAIVFRKAAIDDLFIFLATVFAIGLSVLTLVLASNGLGELSPVTIKRANIIMKGYYASELLYVASMCFAKLSILVLFYNVVALSRHRFVVLGFGIFIFVWSIVSAGAISFQCGMPRPWEIMTLRCFNTQIFWLVYSGVDTVTEISIVILSIDLVAHLRVRLSRKFAVVACFAPRIFVVAASVVRAIYFDQVTPHTNPAFSLWRPTVCTQVEVCASICTACIPYMMPFFKSLQSKNSVLRSVSTRSWNIISGSSNMRGRSPNLLKKRDAKLNYYLAASPDQSTDRVSKVPPYIPSPEPISPFLPPPDATYLLPNSAIRTSELVTCTPDEMSMRGTSFSATLYDSESEETFELCPSRNSMTRESEPYKQILQAGHTRRSTSDDPAKPPPAYSLLPSGASSVYSSGASTLSTPRSPQQAIHDAALLSPLDWLQSQTISSSPTQSVPGSCEDSIRRMNRQTLPKAIAPSTLDGFPYPTRSASTTTYHPKFSTTPRLYSPPSTPIPPLPRQ